MRQILNVGFHLLALFGIYKALVGAVKKVYCREARESKEVYRGDTQRMAGRSEVVQSQEKQTSDV